MIENSKDINEVKQALTNINPVGASQEKLFDAINLGYNTLKKSKSPLFVVVTDETGDDAANMEKTLNTLSRKKSRVHVLSTPASFGNKEWHWTQVVDPILGKTEHYKSSNGPASGTKEILFDFFFVQRSHHTNQMAKYNWKNWAVSAGWAPYNLAYISQETKGAIYLIATDSYLLDSNDFDIKKMKRYQPEIAKPSTLLKSIAKDFRRKAVHRALEEYYKKRNLITINRNTYLGNPSSPVEMKKKMIATFLKSNIKNVEKNMVLIEDMIDTLEDALKKDQKEQEKAKKYSTKEEEVGNNPSLRWQANLELNYALAYSSYYEMLQYKEFLKEAEAGRIDTRYGGVPDNPDSLRKAELDTAIYAEILMLPHDDDHHAQKKVYSVVHGDSTNPLSIVKTIMGKKKIDKLSLEEVEKIANVTLEFVEHNHANTPWAVLAQKTRSYLGPYGLMVYIFGNSTNTNSNQ